MDESLQETYKTRWDWFSRFNQQRRSIQTVKVCPFQAWTGQLPIGQQLQIVQQLVILRLGERLQEGQLFVRIKKI